MLTLLLYVLIVGLVAALLFLVASAVFGRSEELGPLPEGTTATVLPVDGITGGDVRALRFQQVLRGYKAGEVDWALTRLAARIDELEWQLAQARAGHPVPDNGTPQRELPTTPQREHPTTPQREHPTTPQRDAANGTAQPGSHPERSTHSGESSTPPLGPVPGDAPHSRESGDRAIRPGETNGTHSDDRRDDPGGTHAGYHYDGTSASHGDLGHGTHSSHGDLGHGTHSSRGDLGYGTAHSGEHANGTAAPPAGATPYAAPFVPGTAASRFDTHTARPTPGEPPHGGAHDVRFSAPTDTTRGAPVGGSPTAADSRAVPPVGHPYGGPAGGAAAGDGSAAAGSSSLNRTTPAQSAAESPDPAPAAGPPDGRGMPGIVPGISTPDAEADER